VLNDAGVYCRFQNNPPLSPALLVFALRFSVFVFLFSFSKFIFPPVFPLPLCGIISVLFI
jgi:hypothetical protein